MRGAFVLLLLTVPLGITGAQELSIDDFERAQPQPWAVQLNGSVTGQLGIIFQGHTGRAAEIQYTIPGTTGFVSANLTAGGISPTAIGLWLRSPLNLHPRLRLVDSTKCTLQYALPRPVYATDPSQWYRVVLRLDTPVLIPANAFSCPDGGSGDGIFHPPLSSLSVLATVPFEPPAIGALDFDEVHYWNNALTDSLDPLSPPDVSIPGSAAQCQPGMGVSVHFTDDLPALIAAADAGFSFARTDVFWSGVESIPGSGNYNFSKFDVFQSELDQVGMKGLLILQPSQAAPFPWATTDAGVIGMANMAEAMATHFADSGMMYELVNEPNVSSNGAPVIDAGAYAYFAQVVAQAIHGGNPRALVTTGGISGFDFTYLDAMLAGDAEANTNAISIHPYRQDAPENNASGWLYARQDVAASSSVPLWQTEWGYSEGYYTGTGDSSLWQGVMVARELLYSCASQIPLTTYYDLINDVGAGGVQATFGLLNADLTPKPSFFAAREALRTMKNHRFVGMWNKLPTGLFALKFQSATDVTVVVWTSVPQSTATLYTPLPTSAVDFQGQPLTATRADGGAVWTILEQNGPVYLTYSLLDGGVGPSGPPTKNILSCSAAGEGSAIGAIGVIVLTWFGARRKRSVT